MWLPCWLLKAPHCPPLTSPPGGLHTPDPHPITLTLKGNVRSSPPILVRTLQGRDDGVCPEPVSMSHDAVLQMTPEAGAQQWGAGCYWSPHQETRVRREGARAGPTEASPRWGVITLQALGPQASSPCCLTTAPETLTAHGMGGQRAHVPELLQSGPADCRRGVSGALSSQHYER